jgi:hypothetical protein
MAEVTRASIDSADPPGVPGTVKPADGSGTHGSLELPSPTSPIERVMSTVIRKLAWSRLADPKVAVTLAGVGLLLGILVGATAPNTATLQIRLPLSHILPSLGHYDVLTLVLLYAGDIFACMGLAGMLWAHSQGWRPDARHLLLVSGAVVAVMVSLTPVGSSDTASYASFGRITAQGGNPWTTSPQAWLTGHPSFLPYYNVVGKVWKNQVSVYGPIATWVQKFAAWIGGPNVATTIWVLMILNGLVFIGVGWLLLKTSDDPVRATLLWTANPVLIQQLVSGGHLDTFQAAAAICAIQVARRVSGLWGDVLIGVLIGLACGVKINAVLVALGLAWPLLRRHEWMRLTRIVAASLVTLGALYSFYGLAALKPLIAGSKWVILPSPWRLVQAAGEWIGEALGQSPAHAQATMTTIISPLWVIALIVIAWFIYQRISSDQPREVVAPFALTFAWVLAAPWVFPWYTAIAWVTLTQVPRNRMTRWLAIVTVLLAVWHSGGGQGGTAGQL